MPMETNPTLRNENSEEKACIPSIEQLRAKQIKIETELYKQLIMHTQRKFRKIINDNERKLECTLNKTDDEDQLLNCL